MWGHPSVTGRAAARCPSSKRGGGVLVPFVHDRRRGPPAWIIDRDRTGPLMVDPERRHPVAIVAKDPI
jgi:hypothetical protein